MFEYIPSYFDINVSFFVLLIIGIVSGIFAYYQYKRTIPPVSKPIQIFLGIIRGAAVASVLLLLFAPEFTAVWQRTESGKLIVAIDKSASMGIVENNQSRLDRALMIADDIVSAAEKDAQVLVYGFDIDTTQYFNLVMDTSRLGTNIDKSLRTILDSEKRVSNLVLISDGNFSVGDNPLYSDYLNQLNLYSIGIGDTIDLPDVMITEVKSNKIVYQNQSTAIEVYLMSRGIDSQRLNLSMEQDNRVLQAKEVQINGEGKTVVAEFEITPEKVGLNQFDFTLQSIPNEAVIRNNYYTISMEVLKGKIELGLLASKPGYESKFLHQMFSNEKDINFHMSVRLPNGKYFASNPNTFIDSLDVVILHNYPLSVQSNARTGEIIDRLKIRRIPTLVILSEKILQNQLKVLKSFFPIKSVRNSGQIIETQIEPTIVKDQLPLLNIFEDGEAEQRFWNICPPIQYPYADITFESPVKQLLQTRKSYKKNYKHPVMVAQETKGRKGILLLGSGFWRWDFLLSEDKVYRDSWQQMLRNTIRWLDTGAVDKNVILSTVKKNYQVGENVRLSTQVYDGSYKSVNDGLIRTTVSGPSVSFETESIFIEDGRYEGTFVPLTPGWYRIRSEAWRNNVNLGEDEIEIVVTTVNREFLTTRQNLSFLKRLSEKSGGSYFNEDEADDLLKSLDLTPELKRESETFELWNRWPFLLLIIFFLCLEWFIRKKKDLA
jgi:hypothetical protein